MQMNVIENYVLPSGRSLGLKVVHKNGRPESPYAPEDFRWNLTPGGETEAPDWNSEPECGGGLHLWAWAQGDTSASRIWGRSDVVWMAVEYKTSKAVDLIGKVKVPKCRTIAVSPNRKEVVSFIQGHTPEGNRGPAVDVNVVEVGEGEVGEVGDGGVVGAGDYGKAKAGHRGLACVGDKGTAQAGEGGTAMAGNEGHAEAGDFGRAGAGMYGTALAGDGGTAFVMGGGGCAIVGAGGFAWAGLGSKAKAGKGGFIFLMDGNREWLRRMVYDDPEFLKPDTFYRLDDSGNFVEVE